MITPIARYFNPMLRAEMAGVAVHFRDGEGLSVQFHVTRTTTTTPDTATVSIANLDPVRAKAMGALFASTGSSTLKIQAGYDGVTAGLFTGTVRQFSSGLKDGPDTWTKAIADDGGDAYSDTPIRISNAGMTALQMVQVAAAAMRVVLHPSAAAIIAASDASQQGPYTAVMTGKASDLLDAAARRLRCRWWIRDGQVVLSRIGFVDQSRPAVVIKDEALVQEPSIDGTGLATFEVFLDPNLIPGSQVRRNLAMYRVEAVTHRGETRRGLWTSTVTGRAL